MTQASLPVIDDLSQTELAVRIGHLLDNKTKPLRSLGRLEDLASQLGCILGTAEPVLEQPHCLIFAADLAKAD